jgi:NTE family protein
MSTAADPAPAALGPEEISDEAISPGPGIGICLSGGGYRAMLFHVGALWRLNEVRLLTRAARISSVSGGSIAAGWLALSWAKQKWKSPAIPANQFRDIFAAGLLRLAEKTIDIPSILRGFLPCRNVGREVAQCYNSALFKGATLQDITEEPRFVFNASNIQTGALWRFSRKYMGDYKVGLVATPRIDLAMAVAASSAFPPVLSPIELSLLPEQYALTGKETLHFEPFNTRPVLSDGGVYDNLGLETVFKRYTTVLVSDGGAPFTPEKTPAHVWPWQLMRVLGCIDNQVRSLRKRALLDRFTTVPGSGAYWGIGTPLNRYPKAVLRCCEATTARLAQTPTRLSRMDERLQRELVNWGYVACASSLESHFPQLGSSPAWPYPEAALA